MNALVRAELLKLWWTRATWAFVAVAFLLVALRVELLLAAVGQVGGPAAQSEELTLAVLSTSGLGVIVLLGVVTMTREFHHATWTSTLLSVPDRRRVVLAKVLAASLAGVGLAFLLLVLTAVAGLISGDVRIVVDGALVRFVLGQLVSAACWAWLGVAVGGLVRNQTAALVVPLLWLLVVETLLPAYGLGAVTPFTPGGATRAVAGEPFPGALPLWAAALVLLGYGFLLTVLGTRRLVRSDVC
jgi:ABC-2 type transport system permease protein